MTQFWLGPPARTCENEALKLNGGGATPPLLRFRYIQPPTSPEIEGCGKKAEPVESACVSFVHGWPGAGEMMPLLRTVAFSCSSKRTTSAIVIAPLAARLVEQAPAV